ncbi:MAG: ATP-binding protein [Spirochaetaceae bacterium]|nr:ATP-binding protein [Spirochaetaceae bacterium]
MIERKSYLQKIKTALKRSKVTALLGPRQCGKTTLAKEIAINRDCTFLDLESPGDLNKLQNAELYLSSLENLIIIDEIQLKPELFSIIRVITDRNQKNGHFLILGSASPSLIKDSSETLAGRIEFIDLHGFNLKETGRINQNSLWLKGGFPLSFLAKTEENSLAWREGFIRTFLERDIPQLGINIPATSLRRFWTMLAHSQGQILNSSRLAQSMGLSDKTIRYYVDILTSTYMIRQLQPWHANIQKRQVKSPKIYFTDTGLLHHLLNISNNEQLRSNPIVGTSWEGFAMEQIIRTSGSIDAYFWSTYSGAEMDLLLNLKDQFIGLEFKMNETPKTTKSMFSAMDSLNLDKIWIVYPGEDSYPIHEKIEVLTLWEALERLNI